MNIAAARRFGIFLLLSFLSYATGIGFMETVQNSHEPIQIVESKSTLIIGAILIVIIHTLLNLGLLITMYRILKATSQRLAFIYLMLGVGGTLSLAQGATYLLLPISISETFIQLPYSDGTTFQLILQLAARGNFYSYQLGMILWGGGGLILCFLLQKTRLVPTVFPFAGYFGYLLLICGCIFELVGKPFGVMLSIPGGLVEILLSIWLIVKGFNHINVSTPYKQELTL